MLSRHVVKKNKGVISIHHCEPAAFEQFLLYLYSGKVKLNESNMIGVYSVADRYNMLELKEECRDFMKKSLSCRVICDVIHLTQNHNDSDLWKCATEFFTHNLEDILQTAEWLSFMKENPTEANEMLIKAVQSNRIRMEFLLNKVTEAKPVGKLSEKSHLFQTFTWPVSSFRSLPADGDVSMDSSSFAFNNAMWCLRVYPHGCEKDRTDGYIVLQIVRLFSYVEGHFLYCNSGVKSDDAASPNARSSSGYFQGRKVGEQLFCMERPSDIIEWASIEDNGTVTFFCQLRTDDCCFDASSQTVSKSIVTLCQNFKDVLLSGKNYDVTLKVMRREFLAHQDILRARSPVLKSMLSDSTVQKSNGVIRIRNCDPGVFQQLLLFIYTGNVETLNKDNMMGLKSVADRFDLPELKEVCREFIKITPYNMLCHPAGDSKPSSPPVPRNT